MGGNSAQRHRYNHVLETRAEFGQLMRDWKDHEKKNSVVVKQLAKRAADLDMKTKKLFPDN